jgi:hypothetical protein
MSLGSELDAVLASMREGDRITVNALAARLGTDSRLARAGLLRAHALHLVEPADGLAAWLRTGVAHGSAPALDGSV